MRKFMRKLRVAVLYALCAVVAAASAGFAAVNPFMDVPLNHWAYDAIGQLAARGVLSGYPDGTYKGQQPTTRYEMASAVARALAVIDLSNAAKQDAEMLKRLAVEFKDELDALGVKVDGLDARVGAVENRLGGWKIGGEVRMDLGLETWKVFDVLTGKESELNLTSAKVSMARLEFHRWFGADEGAYFYARLEEDADAGTVKFDKFYVDVPFIWGSTVTAGRFNRDFEDEYRFQIGGATDISNESWFTDRTVDGLGLSKSFGLGSVNFYTSRAGLSGFFKDETFETWELDLFARLQFWERFGLDVGAQLLQGDDSSIITNSVGSGFDVKVSSILTLYGGLRFNFTPNVALKAFYARQDVNVDLSLTGANAWTSVDADSASAYKLILDAALRDYSKFWLELSRLEKGFYLPYGNQALTLVDDPRWNTMDGGAGTLAYDMNIWRVGGVHQWSDKWFTWLYIAAHWLNDPDVSGGFYYHGFQLGFGAEYRYTDNVAFAANFVHVDWDSLATTDLLLLDTHRIQFRTSITF
ncbi:MAG: S-layer homology domain-containing protein [Synergistaceae bacterium]|nr:S-layer homology domain-containing protein [Synergistaceae bacterium]